MHKKRILDIKLPKGQSTFLWGPRKTGKSTYLKERFPDCIYYDFLNTDTFLSLSKRPALLREQLLAMPKQGLESPVILDEVQKVPQILDEVHYLIENEGIGFILCGSSARKLKRNHANLLGGRAWRYELLPFTSMEISDLDLLRVLNHGMLPQHYLNEWEYCRKYLKAYMGDYLKEEIFDEGLTRNIPAFSRFFDAMGYAHGEMINYSNIARDCSVSAKTVKEYYQILVDTLIGQFVEPYSSSRGRHSISSIPKFYLFDPGLASFLKNRVLRDFKGSDFGAAFEHFIYTEIRAYSIYSEKDFKINYWRTKSGVEVDFILNRGEAAIEVKSDSISNKSLHGLKAFREDFTPTKSILVSNEETARIVDGILILPWREFLHQLWGGEIL